jgi:lysozyme
MSDRLSPAAPARVPLKPAMTLAACAAACLAAAVANLKTDEGKKNVGYLDLAKVPTDCFGHTGPEVRVGARRSDAQCEASLSADAIKARDGVARCVPGLTTRPTIWAASTRMAYNTGVPAFCASTTARRFNAGQWRTGCDAMLLWNKAVVRGVKVVVPGLAARRERERAQCLTGVAA